MSEKKVMLIDGNSLLYRAFYALPLLNNQAGEYTNGVYGFLTMFNRITNEIAPTHLLVAFDKDRKTFRSEIYSEYKATRSATPDELKGQFQMLRDVLKAMNVCYIEKQGYEGDDIIGTFSKQAEEEGYECIIVTGDKDSLQLVSDQTRVYLTRKGITEIDVYDPTLIKEKYGVEPWQMIEIKALMGDASDNIPGVPRFGEKSAVKLIKQYKTLEGLYENVEGSCGPKSQQLLIENREQAFLSRELATIVRDIPFDETLDSFERQQPNKEELRKMYARLGFKNFLNALADEYIPAETKKVESSIQTHLLDNVADMVSFIDQLQQEEGIGLYIEADYHHPMWAQIKKIYIEYKNEIYELPVEGQKDKKLILFKTILEEEKQSKFLHNAKFAEVLLARYGIQLKGVAGDTLLLTYVLDPAFQGEELAAVITEQLKVDCKEQPASYLASEIRHVHDLMLEKATPELTKLFVDLELPLSGILADMEQVGVKVEKKILADIGEDLGVRLEKHEQEIYALAGSQFNINSPKQLGKILFEDLGLPPAKKTKTGYSTGQEVLEKLYDQHEIIPLIMHFRQLSKLKSTYVDALQGLIHPETEKIHTIFKQAMTATGRLSSVEPNLQNIPVKMEEGRRIRKAFVSSGKDWLIFSADYSQIDLRALAHISGDETLIHTFQEGIDIHTRTASEIFKVPLERVDSDLRRRAKAVNFGIIYGISDFGLARDTGVSRKEAKTYIEQYLDSYPGVQKYMDDIVRFGQENGYVETVLKRRRYLPDLNAKNKMVQSFARRMALNTPIQGTSADIIKIAMLKVARELSARELKSRMLLQVHDELLLEVLKSELEEVAYLVKTCMETAYTLEVPLEVSMKLGTNWYDLQTWE
ncbi:MAG: DNA polymerase I [Bacillota bacterium]|nr:DNA polymerase I [Bacillota bacterium]